MYSSHETPRSPELPGPFLVSPASVRGFFDTDEPQADDRLQNKKTKQFRIPNSDNRTNETLEPLSSSVVRVISRPGDSRSSSSETYACVCAWAHPCNARSQQGRTGRRILEIGLQAASPNCVTRLSTGGVVV